MIVEDHLAIRKGLELLLRDNGLSVVGTSDRAEGAAELIRRRRPDVVVLDVVLPGESGVDLARRLLEQDPHLGVLLYTGTEDSAQLAQALDCGARGVALKAGPPGELVDAVRSLAAGGELSGPEAAVGGIGAFRGAEPPPHAPGARGARSAGPGPHW